MSAKLGVSAAATDSVTETRRMHFLGWQCRIRQHAVRHEAGRPGAGMRPRLSVEADPPIAEAITVLIVEREPGASTNRFRHIVRQSNDPQIRYEKLIEFLCGSYFQHPEHFSDAMTALFSPHSATAAVLASAGRCVLHFDQFGQRYRVPCGVEPLEREAAAFQATFWHNAIFNPGLPAEVQVLVFHPDWQHACSDPPAH